MKTIFKISLLCSGLITFYSTTAQTPTPPNGQRWEKVPELTDEFNQRSIDASKWDDYHPHWSGRAPSNFKRGNAFVKDGYLQLRSTLRRNPSTVGNPNRDIWVNSAACVSKRHTAKPGYYYEARIKASSLSMSSAFWFRVGKYSEIDVIEHIGNPSNPKSKTLGKDLAYQYHTNAFDYTGGKTRAVVRNEWFMPSRGRDEFHTYGLWWKADGKLLIFYHNGKEVMRTVPPIPFRENLKMIFDTEVFPDYTASWGTAGLPLPRNLNDNSKNTMLIDWVRTYKLVRGNATPKPDPTPNPTPTPNNNKPNVGFAIPANNATFTPGSNINVTVNASDSDGIQNVKLYLNNQLVRQENVNPYNWGANDNALKNVRNGNYILKAIATDKRGATAETSIRIRVQNASVPQPTPTNPVTSGQLINNGLYKLKNPFNNQNLLSRVEENHNAQMVADGNFTDQQWIFRHLGNNAYTIQNSRTQRYLEVPFARCNNNSNVASWTSANANHQKWQVSKNGNYFNLKPLHCTDQALDRSGGAVDANIITWSFDASNNNQKWEIIKTTRGLKSIREVAYNFGPNPATTYVDFINAPINEVITITNVLGQQLISQKIVSENEQISVASLASGIYFIRIGNALSEKLVISK